MAAPTEANTWPKRKILETVDEVIGEDPRSGKDVVVTFDILECGHKKKRGMWSTGGRNFDPPNVNRRCKPCHEEGRS